MVIAPMPNELAVAHEGRIAWLEGHSSAKEMDEWIKSVLGSKNQDAVAMPRLHQLAILVNMTPMQYAQHHSMLPALRVASKAGTDHMHGDEASKAYSRRLGMLTQRRGAYCCEKCIEEDQKAQHFSWFRRTHHLIGVDWCSVHGCALVQVDDPLPFTRAPHIWLAQGKLSELDVIVPELPDTGFLRRYVDISTALLLRDRPFPADQINSQLAIRAASMGLRISQTGQRPLLSDRLREQAPLSWLNQHLPGWNTKVPTSFFLRIDRLASVKVVAGVGEAYSMVLAALYDSSDEAMNAVNSSTGQTTELRFGRKGPKRGSEFWQGEIWSTYVDCKGVLNDMAQRLNLDKTYLSEMMCAVGLPSLADLLNAGKWRAFIRFSRGEGIVNACAAECIDISELEILLRKCSSRVLKAIGKISANAVAPKARLRAVEVKVKDYPVVSNTLLPTFAHAPAGAIPNSRSVSARAGRLTESMLQVA